MELFLFGWSLGVATALLHHQFVIRPKLLGVMVELRRIRDTIEPVPVSERLPGPEDCDAQGRCWLLYRSASVNRTPTWSLVHRRLILDAPYTHWLPRWALPVPKSEVGG
jgi:hypothetical protein